MLIKNIAEDAYSESDIIGNTFSVFQSVNKIFYLIYSNKNNSIISYDIVNNKKLNEIKNAHEKIIINFKHYFYENKRRDLLMSTSINNVKIWDPKKFECLLNIKKEYSHTYFTTACFYEFSENEIYIITGSVPMNVYDLNGKK